MKQPYVPPELLYHQPQAAPQNMVFTQSPTAPQNMAFTQPQAVPCYALVPTNNFAALKTQKTGAWPYIIWSLILVVFFNPVGTPLSLTAAILSIIANADSDQLQRDRKLSIAAVMCVVATVADIVTFIILATATIHILRGI
jgi:hypothetical protein